MLKNHKLFLFDMDGTIYVGDKLFDFTKELLATIKEKGNRYLFVTNNSSKSVDAYIEKLAKFGIDVTEEDFVTSSQATAYYLKPHHADSKLYVCGTESLKQELRKNGFCITEFGSVPDIGSMCDMIYNATGKRHVIVGKPQPLIPELAMKKCGCTKEETIFVGDQMDTDIPCGLNAGVTTILVMTGETTQEMVDEAERKPTMVLKNAGEIMKML